MTEQQEIRFTFGEGKNLTARQLGYHAVRWSSQMAQDMLTDFEPGKAAGQFPAAAAIVRAPLVAHLYFLAFHAASYLAYTIFALQAHQDVIPQFLAGVKDSMADVRAPNGMALASDDLHRIVSTIARLAQAITRDAFTESEKDTRAIDARHAEATSLMLSLLSGAYTGQSLPDHEAKLPAASTYGIGILLDETPLNLMKTLRTQGLELV